MIISDATVLITLINIDRFDILTKFIDKIYITTEIYKEVSQRVYAKKFIDSYIQANFIEIKDYSNKQLFRELNTILDIGESSAIALAIETNLPLIIDEKKGRRFAKSKGVEIVGLVGIIRYLYISDILDTNEVVDIIKLLNQSDFRISQSLLDMILEK
jgi:predicted nucleic acid-binding protein